MSKKVSTDSYKGVRDFYPEDKYVQKWMFGKMRRVVESFGYIEYDASILEPSELYEAKTGEEIVNEQTYTFEDRGGRRVTLRPEMTPTVARMVAKKKREYKLPLRWYSIPNLFRYERPQKGRLREHYQLNVDIFGIESTNAEIEIIQIAYTLMREFGAEDKDFEIRLNNRKIMNWLFDDYLDLDEDKKYKLSKLIDKRAKISSEEFNDKAGEILGNGTESFGDIIDSNDLNEFDNKTSLSERKPELFKEVATLLDKLRNLGIKNMEFNPSIVRGFDYYTGTVFEIFDTSPENNRSMFGGGRYDDLLDVFDEEKIPGVGFGMGDVTLLEFLDSRDLLPKYKASADLFICTVDTEFEDEAQNLANDLRNDGLRVEVNLEDKKVGDQIAIADSKSIPYVICVGEDEVSSKVYKVKKLEDGEEEEMKLDEILNYIKHKT